MHALGPRGGTGALGCRMIMDDMFGGVVMTHDHIEAKYLVTKSLSSLFLFWLFHTLVRKHNVTGR